MDLQEIHEVLTTRLRLASAGESTQQRLLFPNLEVQKRFMAKLLAETAYTIDITLLEGNELNGLWGFNKMWDGGFSLAELVQTIDAMPPGQAMTLDVPAVTEREYHMVIALILSRLKKPVVLRHQPKGKAVFSHPDLPDWLIKGEQEQ